MKLIPFSILLCLSSFAGAQTLKPDPKPEDLSEPLIGSGIDLLKPTKDNKSEEKKTPAADPIGPRPEVQQTADEGIQIQVEKTTSVPGNIKPGSDVKVYSPWPAKPLYPAPEGWKFAPAPKGVEPFRTEVKLGSGQNVSLAITPFILVPVTDGEKFIAVTEPGYQPDLGYGQRDTVGVMLEKSTQELERHEKQASESIRRLQQLLTSLPKPPKPVAAEQPTQPTEPANAP